eukprot:TRINITY_DN60337_c0_g1_i1.p1 TRINITY_DN60337_c0_g1~~TRINITY_DN60337_c0_g1_i1.p1  ORF type:complete len:382 (+),score=89.55 TRINITY_DN60337_c0_g1_i1:94-1146(+)
MAAAAAGPQSASPPRHRDAAAAAGPACRTTRRCPPSGGFGGRFAVLHGLAQDAGLNGQRVMLLRWRPHMERWQVVLAAGLPEDQGEQLLAEPQNLVELPWVSHPPGWGVGLQGRTVQSAGERVLFRDPDGDLVYWEPLGLGAARYAVNAQWRPPVTKVEFWPEGRPGRPRAHIRAECSDLWRVIELPAAEVSGIIERLHGLLDRNLVRHTMRVFLPGNPVLLQEPVTFADGHGSVELEEKAVVLTSDRAAGTAEVVLPDGERFDVAMCDLLPCPPVVSGQYAELRKEVKFQSGRPGLGPGAIVLVTGVRDKEAEVEYEDFDEVSDKGEPSKVSFEVTTLGLRPLDGRELW